MSAMDTIYTGSNGKQTKLGELPVPYLRNIKDKMKRTGGDQTALYEDVCEVVEVKDAREYIKHFVAHISPYPGLDKVKFANGDLVEFATMSDDDAIRVAADLRRMELGEI